MTDWTIGLYVVFGVVLLPLYMVILGWFVGGPPKRKTALLGVGYLAGISLAIIVGLWMLDLVAGLLVPA